MLWGLASARTELDEGGSLCVTIWRAYLFILVNFYVSFSVSFYRTRHGTRHESYQIAHEVAGRMAKGL